MNYFITIVVILGLIYLVREYISYLKQRSKSEEATKRQENNLLFLCFISITGITSVFKDLILVLLEKQFPLLNLSKDIHYEWIAFVMFIVLVFAFKFRLRNKKTRSIQNHSGTGDNISIKELNFYKDEVKKNFQEN